MEVSGHRKIRRLKLRLKEMIQKRYEGDNKSTERRSARLKNVDNTNLMRPPQMGKGRRRSCYTQTKFFDRARFIGKLMGSKTNNSANYYH